MNVEMPNWRVELYNQYYGSVENDLTYTEDEQALLDELRAGDAVIQAVMAPNANPYSWYEDGEAYGIAADIFKATAEKLGLRYKILPVETSEDYQMAVMSGGVDIWMDMNGYYEDEGDVKYKITAPYTTTTMSVLRGRGASEKIETLVTDSDDIAVQEILSSVWPSAEVTFLDSPQECGQAVLTGKADAALLMSYTAQKLARRCAESPARRHRPRRGAGAQDGRQRRRRLPLLRSVVKSACQCLRHDER